MTEQRKKLEAYQSLLKADCREESTFMGFPDSWYDDHVWVCPSGHIGKFYLKSEALGGSVCMTCHEFVHMFPTEVDPEKLREALR